MSVMNYIISELQEEINKQISKQLLIKCSQANTTAKYCYSMTRNISVTMHNDGTPRHIRKFVKTM